ncbi:MAG TPA: hypothetical protein PKC28_10055 [Bdellovibrionales bacterium]|nr:hypothetical protein [Bdellovibrionales bacterium]
MKRLSGLALFLFCAGVNAKTFQNSYVSFDVPDDWNCLQEGVAWTCTPKNTVAAREAVIIIAAKVAGPEDNLGSFQNYLKKPKAIATKVGTPMPSKVMYAQPRSLAGHQWIQAQHLGSEIQDFYTLYLATVKAQLAILVSFSAQNGRYQVYNPVFDRAMKTLKIVASQELLFPKNQGGANSDVIGIAPQGGNVDMGDMMPPPEPKHPKNMMLIMIVLGAALAALAVFILGKRKKISPSKSAKPRTK